MGVIMRFQSEETTVLRASYHRQIYGEDSINRSLNLVFISSEPQQLPNQQLQVTTSELLEEIFILKAR